MRVGLRNVSAVSKKIKKADSEKRLAVGPLSDQAGKFARKIIGTECQMNEICDVFGAEYIQGNLVALLVGVFTAIKMKSALSSPSL